MKRGFILLMLIVAAPRLRAQDRGAAALGELVEGLGTTSRVLMIGAHPDDEDTQIITWLAKARHVETAYLSLTRGDGGQNLIGNELGPQLGMIRTEELLAARRIDGGREDVIAALQEPQKHCTHRCDARAEAFTRLAVLECGNFSLEDFYCWILTACVNRVTVLGLECFEQCLIRRVREQRRLHDWLGHRLRARSTRWVVLDAKSDVVC